MNNTTSHREPVEKLAEEFAARYRRGERPSLTEYTEKYPELADEIRGLFPALVMMEELGPENDPATGPFLGPEDRAVPQQLGEFHILREVGRGGMGVVYEAVQESLGRHVALKVLPFHSLIVKTHLERFRREARAAARLHHSNIVPVFGVGQHEGLHYYAMQFIQGQGVDAILCELRRLRGHQEPPAGGKKGACDPELTVSVAHGLLTGRFEANERRGTPNAEAAQKAGDSSPPVPLSSTSESSVTSVTIGEHSQWTGQSEAQYFRGVAQVGVQIAEALAYAHNQGVFHRDIKPSNLLLDTRGTVWITDFGLAKSEDSDELTHPGDVVGTTRYMAPERFSGKADARSDLYSLGITLYELLTLRPAFPEPHRAQLIERIAHEEPPRPRRLDPHIPRDLETIVLKATDKEPARRYQTAPELAADLRRFLADRPIQARRAHWPERLWRWCRRNPVVAMLTSSLALILLAVAIGASATAVWLRQERDHAQKGWQEASKAEEEKTQKLWQSYRDQARAGRWSGMVGRRFDSLAALALAAEIRPDLELRNEAIACMALVDVRRVRPRPEIPTDCLERIVFDSSLERYAFSDPKGNITVRRASDDVELLRLAGPGSRAWMLRFSPDGRFLAAKHHAVNQPEPNDLYVYDVPQRKVIVHSAGGVFSWDFSVDGRQLAVADKTGAITLYDLASEQRSSRVLARGPVAQGLAFHPDGRRLAVASPRPALVLIRSLETGEVVSERKFTAGPAALAWHPEGRLLAVGCFHPDWRVHLIDTATDQEKLLEGHHGDVVGVAFSPTGDLLLSSSWDGTTRLWDPLSGRQLVTGLGNFGYFSGYFSADGTHVASGGELWEVAAARECRLFYGHRGPGKGPWSASFSPEGRLLASASSDGVRLWDVPLSKEIAWLPVGDSISVVFHPEGDSLLTSGRAEAYRIPIHPQRKDGATELRVGPPARLRLPDDWEPRTLTLSANGRTLVASDFADAQVLVLDLERQKVLLSGTHVGTNHLAVSPDGRWVASGPWGIVNGTVRIWDVAAGKLACELAGPGASVAFSPDGRQLAVGETEGLRVWQVGSWRPDECYWSSLGRESSRPCAFAPDGKLLAVVARRSEILLLDPARRTELATLPVPDGDRVTALSFSPDGSQLALVCQQPVIRVWDLRRVREQLAGLGLDWDQPAYPPAPAAEPPRPLRAHLLFFDPPGGFYEGESLNIVESRGCEAGVQDMAPWGSEGWSGGRQLFCRAEKGGELRLALDLANAGTYRLGIHFTKAPDFGVVEFSLDGHKLGKPFDGFHEDVVPSGKIDYGKVQLKQGRHFLRFVLVDKNPESTNYFMGIDCVSLEAAPDEKK